MIKIPFVEAEAIIRQEARKPWMYYAEVEDRRQDGWVILLENDPGTPALARTIVRRRLANLERTSRTRKRGAGFAIGRLDAGWEEEIGSCPEGRIVNAITQTQLLKALSFRTPSGSRQALHQAITRAKTRWTRLRKPFDPSVPGRIKTSLSGPSTGCVP